MDGWGPAYGEQLLEQQIRAAIWRRRIRMAYLVMAIASTAALIWLAIK